MRQPIFEDEVFVRAFCAVITGRVAKGTSPLDESPLDLLREEATDVATMAVEAWRNRPTKPGTQRVPEGHVEVSRFHPVLNALGQILEARARPPSNADLLEAAFEHAEEIYNREMRRIYGND